MFEELNQHRAAVEEQIQKGFEIGFTGNEFEKAHNVGDIHPNGKWVWTQLPSGRYDWRVIKKTAGNAATSAPQATANGKKSWDNLSDFYKNGSDERKMWMEWDRFEKTGDPNIISNIRKILEKKFPNVSSWKQYAPNTNNSSKLVAVGADGKEIASIDFGGKGVDLPKLQTFMDACDKVKKESSTSQQQTQWTEKEIADRLPARGAVMVKVGDKRYHLRKVGDKVRVENDYGKSISSASIRQKAIDAYIEGISAKPVASSQQPNSVTKNSDIQQQDDSYDKDEYNRQKKLIANQDRGHLDFALDIVKTNLKKVLNEYEDLVKNHPGRKAAIQKKAQEIRYFRGQKKAFEEAIAELDKTPEGRMHFEDKAYVDNVKEALANFNPKYTDLSKVKVRKSPKGNWEIIYDGKHLGFLGKQYLEEVTAKRMKWLEEDSNK